MWTNAWAHSGVKATPGDSRAPSLGEERGADLRGLRVRLRLGGRSSLPRPLSPWTPAPGRRRHSPPPAGVGLLPAAVTLLRVICVLLAHRIQHGQQLGLRGCGQGHAQEPVQHAGRHHGQPGQVRGQSQLLEESGHDAA